MFIDDGMQCMYGIVRIRAHQQRAALSLARADLESALSLSLSLIVGSQLGMK